MQATPGGGSWQTQARVEPEAQPWGSSEEELGWEANSPTFLDEAGELRLADGAGWPTGKSSAASDPSSCQ